MFYQTLLRITFQYFLQPNFNVAMVEASQKRIELAWISLF